MMTTTAPREKYWFPARRFGLGWGLPTCWQGWLVFAVYLALFVLGVIFLRGKAHAAEFMAFAAAITLAMLLICWRKGEPLRWRWGGD